MNLITGCRDARNSIIKKRLGRARLNVLRFTTFFPHVLFTRSLSKNVLHMIFFPGAIYISPYMYISYIYKFTQSCSLLIAKINSEFLRKIVSTKFSLTRSSFIDRDRIEYYWIPVMLFNRFTKRLKRRTEKALKKRKKEKGCVMKFQILNRRFWRVQLQRCKYKSDSWH